MMWFALAILVLVIAWIVRPWFAADRPRYPSMTDGLILLLRATIGVIILLAAWLALALAALIG